ncbi:hypothetical protein PT300_10500 [Enterobacteriaceae bacterium ESL0689]|nr:hypothetical protein [Enterobacteriaceae bacterium ESL0689]
MRLFVLNRSPENLLNNFINAFIVLFFLSGCADYVNYTLEPPENTQWVNVAIKVPPETEILPLSVLYRSERCQRKEYDPLSESHVRMVRWFNPMQISLSPSDGDGLRRARIALDGGTRCHWVLSGIRVGLQVASTSTLASGKDIIPANYVFDFDNEGMGSGFGKGNPRPVSGDLFFKTEFFPMEYLYHNIDEIDLYLFAGNERSEKWNRYYRVSGIKNIIIAPVFYRNKVVKIKGSGSLSEKKTIIYPDGSEEKTNGKIPDYDKLLRMK